MGIISADFELLLKKNKAILNELSDNLTNLKQSCLNVDNNFNGELSFISNKLIKTTNQLNNILKKSNAYYTTLNSVYNSYQEQSKQNIIDSRKLIS